MKISDLETNQKDVELEAEIVEISPAREFEKFGKIGRVASAVISDGSGKIALTLWNEQIDAVKVGDKVHIAGAYVKEWRGEKQLNVSRAGSLEVIE